VTFQLLPESMVGDPRKQALIVGGFITAVLCLGGGWFAWSSVQETGVVTRHLALAKAEEAQLKDDLAAARKDAGATQATGLRAATELQDKLSGLASTHLLRITSFQSDTAVAVPRGGNSGPPAGWGTLNVEISLKGTSKSTFAFLKDLPGLSLPFAIQELDMTPSNLSPNGGSTLQTRVKITLFARNGGQA
jgi:hypothetical protein